MTEEHEHVYVCQDCGEIGTSVEHLVKRCSEAVVKFAYEIQKKVKLEFEGGGRYQGHLIDPWVDVARPIIYAKASELKANQEKNE